MPDTKKLIQEVYNILSKQIGGYGAELYTKYYVDKTSEQIIESVEGLLTDMVGPTNAKKQLKEIYKQFNLK
ncbi:hypothetical protein ACFL3C_05665 [Patescibacteria group bacterium]